MITVPEYPGQLREAERAANRKEVLDSLVAAVESTLTGRDEVFVRKKYGLVAWKRFCGKHGGGCDFLKWKLYFFCVGYYNSFSFRLNGHHFGNDRGLTRTFWCAPEPSHYGYELSFCAADLPLVASPDLVRFVESTFDGHDKDEWGKTVWRWPLFAHGQSFPNYAWSKAGWKEYERRRECVEQYKEKYTLKRTV
jgi:hypothetical protein